MPHGVQRASLGIDPENNDTVFALVGDQAELPRRVDVEIAWGSNIGGLVFHEG